jgi:hypothetical protein
MSNADLECRLADLECPSEDFGMSSGINGDLTGERQYPISFGNRKPQSPISTGTRRSKNLHSPIGNLQW